MNIDRQVNLWDRAQIARSSANWSLLLQCLGQLIEEGDGREVRGFAASASPIPSLKNPKQAKLLVWAMDVLEFGDFHQRWDIAKLLPKLGKSTYGLGVTEVIAPLIEVLEDEDADEELRWFSVRILGNFNHADVIAALVELLKTSVSVEEKAMAAAALAEIGASAVAAITELLAESDTRLLAVRSLSYIRHSETIAPLLSVVRDPQIEVRAAAIEALSSFHDSRIPPVLLNALDDLGASVRREAAIGLSFRPDLREELDLVNRLLPRLYDLNLDVCIAAAIALGRLGTDAAATGLFQVLHSSHTPAVQIEIVRSLGRVGTENSLEYLRSSLNLLASKTIWQEIVTVLGRIEQQQLKPLAAEILIELLKSHHPATENANVKQAIAMSLGQLGEIIAIDRLIQLLADTDAAVRLHAIAALKQLAPETAYHKLEQMARDTDLTPELQQGVAIALQEWAIASE